MSIETRLINSERLKVTFDVEELINIYDGGKLETALRRRVEQVIMDDPELCSPPSATLTRNEKFVEGIRRTVHLYKKVIPKHGWSNHSSEFKCIERAIGFDRGLGIHTGVFTPCIRNFGSDAQIAKWLPLAENFNIIGSYAQTELAHGTYLRGLETTATYDCETEEFVINCPFITSMKWWPGDMGKCANHVFLMASMFIDGKKYGMHPFIVQIRDLSTHQPLPGVSVGDIGTKLGFETTDNGFLYLRNIRIPRENLMSKNAEVKADGTYVKKTSDRMMYGSMVNLRVNLPKKRAIDQLAKAATIAVRYSTVRRQGSLMPDGEEIPVMDYLNQQHKLLPQVATAYVLNFVGEELKAKYQKFLKKAAKGDLSDLPELHALSASYKAGATEQCAAGVEICRRACGGHGYSNASGLPMLLAKVLPSCTYEGENTVLYLQTARYLLRCANESQKGQLPYAVFLKNFQRTSCPATSLKEIQQVDVLVRCYQALAGEMVLKIADKIRSVTNKGMPMHDAKNNCSVQLVDAAKAFFMQYVASDYAEFLAEVRCTPAVKEILTDLFRLYALHKINGNSGDFIKVGHLSPRQCEIALEAELELLQKLRLNAVGLVDAFDFRDNHLESCLGAYDGNVYERLYDLAKLAPLNRTAVHEESYQYLRPCLLEGRDILEGVKPKL